MRQQSRAVRLTNSNTSETTGLTLSDKEDMRRNRLHNLCEKIEARTLTNWDELYEILACYGFLQRIYQDNPKAFRALMELADIEILSRGRVVTMYGEKALKTYFVLKGQLAAYVRTAVSSDKSKSYKEEYGEELVP